MRQGRRNALVVALAAVAAPLAAFTGTKEGKRDDGLALELTAKGTKYYQDTELN
ncbi:MAG: hypothetical protein OEX21_00190 [Betaproteobacteria bacterium]|nr:hypothetical protein [Betaproteobacteria bacterium]